MVPLQNIDNTWTLFLDRDGVINVEKNNGYIFNYDEFEFYDGVREAIEFFSTSFGKIIVVTNQRGVGKNIMTEEDLHSIHEQMLTDIKISGGEIHKIYYCTAVEDFHPNRKPNLGMLHEALRDFPQINLEKSIMVGDKPIDMEFGKNAGMHTIFITSTNPEVECPHPQIDLMFASLQEFANAVRDAQRT